MSDTPAPNPGPTPTGYQRTTGGKGFKWQPPTAEHLSKLLPQYEIECILGHGGMGAVYKGKQKSLDRLVAIKILPPELDDEDASYVERFKNEAKVMAKFIHPAIVAVHDFGETSEGQLYIVMEYVDGTDVQKMIQSQGRLPPEHALAITAHVCDALRYAHEHGVIHRDIKPANILINMEGAVKVADFGLAKAEEHGSSGLTKTGMAMGTPDYVAPEALIMGVNVDGRADLYAIGVMLYNMLTGNVPRGMFKPASLMLPGTDPRFDAIVAKAMQHDREDRYQSAAEIRRDLDVILTTPLVQAGGQSSAAIPKASIAQKPVAKGPQKPMGKSANVPVRSTSASAGEPKSEEAAPPSKSLAWVIPTAVSAVVILGGAFYMRGKIAATPAEEPAPIAAKATGSVPIKVREEPKPTPAPVAKSPTLPVSKSSDPQFPPGKWVRVFTKFEDLPEDLRKAGVKFEDGWIRLGETKRKLTLPAELKSNYAVRGRFLRHGLGENNRIMLRQPASTPEYYLLGFEGSKLDLRHHKNSVFTPLSSIQTASLAAGSEYTLQFGAVGDRLIGWYGETIVATAEGSQLKQGTAFLFGSEDLRDIEVINLDGLSEAEALKILGVDEKGNDLRQSAPVAATAPSVSTTPSLPISKSPSLPVPASSDPKFPPGQWVKVFETIEEMNRVGVTTKQGTSVSLVDGWFVPSVTAIDLRLNQQTGTNLAIRAKFKPTPERIQFDLFSDLSTHRFTTYHRGERIDLAHLDMRKSGAPILPKELFGARFVPSPNQDFFTVEFAHVGGVYVGRVNGNVSFVLTDQKRSQVRPCLYSTGAFSDIEVINLDGLPEAEALRILGVDEKGNDLRAAIAKQEQQMAEQAKVVDAMAAIPELKVLHDQFTKLTNERVNAPFEADVAKLNSGYLGGLDREIANAKKVGHLDGVIALEAEKKLIADKQPLPAEDVATTTEALKKLRGIYRAAYAKIEAARAENLKTLTDPLSVRLKQLEAELTQKDRVPDAKTVREYREGLGRADGPPSAAAAPPRTALGGPSALPVAAPKASRSKPDLEKSRQAVEYALGKGCEVSIDHDGVITPVKKLEDLPKSRWGLHRVKFLTPVTDEDLLAVTRAVELKEFVCNDRVGAGTFTSLTALGNTPALKVLVLSRANTEFSPDDAQALLQSAETLQQLTWLKLPRSDALLPVLVACKNLDYLYLQDAVFTDDDMDLLRSLSQLRSLSFRGSKLTDVGARHIAKFNKPLSRLLMTDPLESGDTQLTQEGLATILKVHGGTLIQLNIGSQGSSHTEGMLRSIAADCSVLETLAIRGVTSPEALAGLSKLKKLKQLEFPQTSAKSIPLSVAHCQAISGIKSLETLGVSDCALTDEHVHALGGLKSLKTLHLNRSPGITDASVPLLLSFQELENLGLVNAGLTPAGVLKLTALKKLKTLTTTGINFTDAHLAQFKAALPGCNVTR